MHSDGGQNILVVGRFRGLKKSDIIARLTHNGHRVVRSLSRASLVLAGSGANLQVEEALAQGIPVTSQADLDTLAPSPIQPPPQTDEPDLAAWPPAPRPVVYSPEEKVRWAVARPYDARSWNVLCLALEPLSAAQREGMVAEIEDAVCDWPAHQRYCDPAWLEAALDGRPEPRLRLVGNLVLSSLLEKHPRSALRRVLEHRSAWLPSARQLRINHTSGRSDWLELLEPALLAGLTEFDFMYNSLGPAGLKRVLDAIPCAETTILDLRSNALGTQGATLLAEAGLERLEWLQLYQNDIKDTGLAALCAPGVLPALRYLSVEYNHLSAKSGATLARAPFASQLTTLKVKYNDLQARGAASLAQGPLAALERLDISANEIGDEGLLALARSRTLERLTRLDVEGNNNSPLITDVGMQALAENPGMPMLRELWMQLNEVTSAGLETLLTAERRRSLAVLSVQNNDLSADALSVLSRADLPVQLSHLRIGFQKGSIDGLCRLLRDAGALSGLEVLFLSVPWMLRTNPQVTQALLAGPAVQNLQALDLWECALDTAAVQALIQTPFPHLRKLNTSNAGMSDAHYRMLRAAPWLAGLEELVISNYPKLGNVQPLKDYFADTQTSFVAF